MIEIISVVPVCSDLGERPVWSVAEQVLYWVDIKAPALHRFDPANGQDEQRPMPDQIGVVAPRAQGGLIGGLGHGVKFIDFATGRVEPVLALVPARPGNRINDGGCDRRGRFWIGTMDDAGKQPSGALYRVDADRSCREMWPEVHLANGLGWSPDDRVMYVTDTMRGLILAFDFDVAEGRIANPREFVRVPPNSGFLDGLAVDAEGFVWSAHWAGARLTRFTPDGRIDRMVEMPVPNVTSCCFGGPGLDVLYVTTASHDMTPQQLDQAPLSGNLFAVHGLGVRGLPETPFAG